MGETPLGVAVESGNKDGVKCMIEAKGDLCIDEILREIVKKKLHYYVQGQSMLRPSVITQLLHLPWARKQVISGFRAQGKRRSCVITNYRGRQNCGP